MKRIRTTTTIRVMLYALLFGLAFWIIHGLMSYYLFTEHFRFLMFQEPLNLLDALILRVPGQDLAVRVVFMIACLIGGSLFAQQLANLRVAHAALQRSEQRYRLLAENASDVIWLLDPITQRFTYVSPSVKQLVGYTPQEVLQQTIADVFTPASLQATTQWIDETRATIERTGQPAEPFTAMLEQPRKDGSLVMTETVISLIAHNGNPAAHRILGVSRDATARMAAQQQIQTLLTRMQQTLNTVPAGVMLVGSDGRVTLHNTMAAAHMDLLCGGMPDNAIQCVETLAGRPFEELLRRPASGFWHMFEREGRRFELQISPLESQASEARWVFVGRDVTEEHQLEIRVRQRERMAVIGRLAGGVAHDFNNILTAIRGYVELVLDQMAPTDPRRTDLIEVRKAADKASGLTNQLLVFSRKQRVMRSLVNLNDIVHDMQGMIRRLIGEDVAIAFHLEPDLGTVLADKGQLEQVLLNLVVNARDAMPNGGTLIVETENLLLDEEYAHSQPGLQAGPYVMLAVSDTGIGMDDEVLSHLFEPFYTTKQAGKGTGLGLATVYGIVRQADGDIHVYSEVEHGSTFKVYLPQATSPEQPHQGADAPIVDAIDGQEAILLVEDEQMVRRLAERILKRHGYRVFSAASPAEATELATSLRGQIDLLITDVVMPGGSGQDLAPLLSTDNPEMRVLFVSGYTDDVISQRGLLKPGTAFLGKPFTPSMLARKVRQVLDE